MVRRILTGVTVQTHLKREVFFAAFREKPEYNDENPIAYAIWNGIFARYRKKIEKFLAKTALV